MVLMLGSLFRYDVRILLVLAIVLAILLAQDQDEGNVARMAAFFDILGDVLGLFALQPELFRGTSTKKTERETDALEELSQPAL
ncbi:MAG: hypothetical protein HFF50_05665 [Lawsonibacter sp.]|nr:hypothetical protein [Lawsonibacter sp.]